MAIKDAFIEAGKLVILVLPNGTRRMDYRLKERLYTRGKGHLDVDPMDLQDHGFPTGWHLTPPVNGYRVLYPESQQTLVEECDCGGKGVVDTQLYGVGAGSKRRVKCCAVCTWTPGRKKKKKADGVG